MTLHKNNSLQNLNRSLRQFCITNLETAEGLSIFYDKTYIESHKDIAERITEWVVVDINTVNAWSVIKTAAISFYLHTRSDPEGDNLATLRDNVVQYLEDPSANDGQVRIPLYDTSTVKPWDKIGDMLVFQVGEGPLIITDDNTKFRELTVLLRWAI